MVVEGKNNEKITISFSGKVGREGLNRIKSFIEFLEKNEIAKKQKPSTMQVTNIANTIDEAAWRKFKKAKNLK